MAACRELDSDAEPGLDDADSAASHGDQSGRGHAPSDPKHGSGRPRKSDPRPDSRSAILEAVLDAKLAGRQEVLRGLPDTMGEIFVAWSRANLADPSFFKLIMREALEHRGPEPVRKEDRQTYYRAQIEMVRELQDSGKLPAGLEPKYLFLALLAVVTLPALLPQIAALVSDEATDDKAFRDGWHRFLRGFADRLSAPNQ